MACYDICNSSNKINEHQIWWTKNSFINLLHTTKLHESFKVLIDTLKLCKVSAKFILQSKGLQFLGLKFLKLCRSSQPEVFRQKGVLKIVQNSEENTLSTGRSAATGVFLWMIQNFWEHLFLQNTSGGCFWPCPKITC